MNSKIKTLLGILAIAVLLTGGCSGENEPGASQAEKELEISVNGNSTMITGIELPINRTEAETIVRECCEVGNQSGCYKYALMEEVDGEWRVPISNSTPPCYATVNETTGETNCSYTEPIPPEPKEITITTDKTEYAQGEVVNITVKNNLDEVICCECWEELLVWSCYFSSQHTRIQKFEDGEWEGVKLYAQVCNRPSCSPNVCNRSTGEITLPPCSPWADLKVGEEVGFEWGQKVWNREKNYDLSYEDTLATPGKYRLSFFYYATSCFTDDQFVREEERYAYSNNFTITAAI